ncbi:MAG: tetratricopeptide repeat protein [Pseudomonadota bacterium]|nr:tetratricopeptide repeat protein [Pseudomonadota bacterium]
MKGLTGLLLLGMLLTGCAVRAPAPPAAPMEASVELEGSPALSLLHKSQAARQQGQTAAAERYLERALNIAPDSSWLYKSLADLRLFEGDARSAEGFALKALRLAPEHPEYRAELWQMVATARERQGDKAGAEDARARAADALAAGQPV